MTFEESLERTAQLVDGRLAEMLVSNMAPERLAAAMRHGALGGGKRLRPFLAVECAALFDIPTEQVLDAATAIECLHCYSLVHDDLPAMDDDALRRGRPTVHVAFDEATAILAGDSLLTIAFEIMARPETHSNGDVRADLVLALARASGWEGMAGGQMLDLQAENQPSGQTDIGRIHKLKTAALLACSCELGAIIGRAGDEARTDLKTYGKALGLAFQLTDDLLDVTGDPTHVGKATGKDADAGKATLVERLGVDGARRRVEALETEAIEALTSFGGKADRLRDAARFVTRRTH